MHFNPEISVGNLITAASVVVAAVGAFYALKGSVKTLASDVANSVNSIRELLRIHNDRVDRIERRHEERFSTMEETMARLTSVVERLSGRWDGYERRSERNGHDTGRRP